MSEHDAESRLRPQTYARVKAELDRVLFDEGRVANAAQVKARIGGGTDQILAATAQWEKDLAQRLLDAERIQGLPKELASAVQNAYLALDTQLKEKARAELEQYVREADAKVAAAAERAALTQAQHDAIQRRADDLAIERDGQAERIRVLDAALQSAHDRAAAAEARIDEYRMTVERTVMQAEKDVNAEKALRAVEQTRYDEMERRLVKENEQLKKERDQIQKQMDTGLDAYRAKLAEAQDALSQGVGRIAVLQETEIKLEQRVTIQQQELLAQREALAERRALLEREERITKLQHEMIIQNEALINTLRTTAAQHEAQLAALTLENTALKVAAAKQERGGKRD